VPAKQASSTRRVESTLQIFLTETRINKKSIVKYFMLLAALVFTTNVPAQTLPPKVSTPQHIVVDSKDNVFVTLKYVMLKIGRE
jgi:hypothetical protein